MVNDSFEQFLAQQQEIYARFRDTSRLRQEGTMQNASVQHPCGGYLIIYRHAPEINQRLAAFSQNVGRIIPSMQYAEHTAHTTISDYMLGTPFTAEAHILDALAASVQASLPLQRDVRIEFSAWLVNQSGVLAEGNPNRQFWNHACAIIDNARERGLTLRYPWGAHMTVNRFLERVDDPGRIASLLTVVSEGKPLGPSRPVAVDVGHFDMSPSEFTYTAYKTFSL